MTRYFDCSQCDKGRARAKCSKPRARSTCSKPKSKAACPNPKGKCSKPGPLTNNGYLNFLRSFRKRNCGLPPRELISKAARAWNCLPESKKDRYRRQACTVTKNPRHKRRKVCKTAKKQCH